MDDVSDNVTPFRRSVPERLPPAQEALSDRVRRAAPGARALAAAQAAASREGYMTAVFRQRDERLIASGRVVPARITMALDSCGLDGPDVDAACGAAEPDVDMWELALAVPSHDQVEKLAALTGFTAAWFYMPLEPGPMQGGTTFICGDRHCETREPDVIGANGVLLYEGRPREAPAMRGALF